MIQNVNNDRARMAYNFVEENIKKSDNAELKKEFRTLARSFPTMVHVNGVGTAIAFLFSKKGEAYQYLLETLEKRISGMQVTKLDNNKGLMKTITSCNNETYQLITQEIMAYMQWIKRFSEGMLEV